MSAKRAKKNAFTLHELVKRYIYGDIAYAVFFFMLGIALSVYALLTNAITHYGFLLSISLALCAAVYCVAKIIGYRPLYKETSKIKAGDLASDEIYVARMIKKRHRVSKTLSRISVYIIDYYRENTKNRYYYLPLDLDDKHFEKLVKHPIHVNLYRGTSIIESYSALGNAGCANPVGDRQRGVHQGEKPDGLWGDMITAYESGRLKTIWSADISVDYCSYDAKGDMIDLALIKGGRTICFNIDKNSIYVSFPPSDSDETLPLTQFENLNILFSYMTECTEREEGNT